MQDRCKALLVRLSDANASLDCARTKLKQARQSANRVELLALTCVIRGLRKHRSALIELIAAMEAERC